MPRNSAIGWVRDNCRNPGLQADFIRKMDEAIASGLNCSFLIGAGNTFKGFPFLLYCFADELFITELTHEQAAKLGIAPNQMRCRIDAGEQAAKVPSRQISVEGLKMESDTISDPSQPIRGTFRYRTEGTAPRSYCVEMDYASGTRTVTNYIYLPTPLLDSGEITVAFPPLGDRKDQTTPGMDPVILAFVRICAVPDPRSPYGRQPVSNAATALLEIV